MKPERHKEEQGANDNGPRERPMYEGSILDDGDDAILDAIWDRIGAEEKEKSARSKRSRKSPDAGGTNHE